MTTANEYTLVEKPILDLLTGTYGYRYIHPDLHPTLRPRENEVLFEPLLLDALMRINGIARGEVEWHLHDKEIDAVSDQWFANEPAENRAHVLPDGFKAQICAIDRLACVAYKQALDRVIAKSLMKTEKLSEEEAKARAVAMSVCVYSPGQHDGEQHPELVTYQIPPEEVTPKIVPKFRDANDPLKFLIVCNKLLTGFDAPIEQVMYLYNPLTDHNLLQAIARTNRRYGPHKDHGLIVDYPV